MTDMIAPCTETHLPAMFAVINDAAQAYRGHVSDDCLHEPYMPEDELRGEIAVEVRFFGWFEDGELLGVMSIQDAQDVTLIRHAYVATRARRPGPSASTRATASASSARRRRPPC